MSFTKSSEMAAEFLSIHLCGNVLKQKSVVDHKKIDVKLLYKKAQVWQNMCLIFVLQKTMSKYTLLHWWILFLQMFLTKQMRLNQVAAHSSKYNEQVLC